MQANEGTADRAIRIILGLILSTISFLMLSGIAQILLIGFAGMLIFTGITGFCGLYKLLGINTCKINK